MDLDDETIELLGGAPSWDSVRVELANRRTYERDRLGFNGPPLVKRARVKRTKKPYKLILSGEWGHRNRANCACADCAGFRAKALESARAKAARAKEVKERLRRESKHDRKDLYGDWGHRNRRDCLCADCRVSPDKSGSSPAPAGQS